MRTDGQTIRGNEIEMGGLRTWAKKNLSRERIAVTTTKVVVVGYLGIFLAQVLQAY